MFKSTGLSFLLSTEGQRFAQQQQMGVLLIRGQSEVSMMTPEFAAMPEAHFMQPEPLLRALGRPEGLSELPQDWVWRDASAQDWLLKACESEGHILLTCQALTALPRHQAGGSADLIRIQSRVLENMDQCLVVTDPHQENQPIVYVSPRFLAETGYTAEEVLGHNCRFLQGPRTNPATIERIRLALRHGEVFRGEILNYRKDGSPFWNLLTISPVFGADGSISHFVGLQNDITALKKNAEVLAQSVQQLTRQNLDLQQFAYITSHNLRAPVANVLGLIPLLKLKNEDADFRERLLDGIDESAHQLDLVVRDLNAVLSLRQELQDPSEVVVFQALWEEVRAQTQTDAVFQLELDLACPSVMSIRSYLSEILQELFKNALKFSQPERPLTLRLRTFYAQGAVVLAFEDTGSGMDLSQIGERLFGLYRRFHRDRPGRGLGLYLVKTRVDILGGSIEVESRVGVGSVFRICLPHRGEYA